MPKHSYLFLGLVIMCSNSVAQLQPSLTNTTEFQLRSSGVTIDDLRELDLVGSDPSLLAEVLRQQSETANTYNSLMLSNEGVMQAVPKRYISSEIDRIADSDLKKTLLALLEESESYYSDCDEPAKTWFQLTRAFSPKGSAGSLASIISNVVSGGESENFVLRANLYDKNCLSAHTKIPKSFVDAGIEKLVSFLMFDDAPICGAVRIRENTFATARHCIYNRQTGGLRAHKSSFNIAILDNPGTTYEVKSISTAIDRTEIPAEAPFSISSDYLYLTTENVTSEMPEYHTDPVQQGESILLIGYFRFHDIESTISQANSRITINDWVDGVRWTNAPMCAIGEIADKCMLHYCQSDARFSGAPIFSSRLRDNKISIAGLHVAAAGLGHNCAYDNTYSQGNIAIKLETQ